MAPTSTTLHRRIYASPLGELTLTASEQGLRSLTWPEEAGGRAPADGPPIGDEPSDVAAVFDHTIVQLDEYFAGERTEFDVPLDPVGTEFQLRAWAALRRIPYGETRSYGEQARTIGSPAAVRAVGAANGRNPISIIVPCHRVVGSDGSLTGFGGGLDAKRYLLDLETRAGTLFG
ncbi:MAG: methylated-DNA--[protein]-cysteine S-methyltransferase [Microthrixaceae bacterium]